MKTTANAYADRAQVGLDAAVSHPMKSRGRANALARAQVYATLATAAAVAELTEAITKALTPAPKPEPPAPTVQVVRDRHDCLWVSEPGEPFYVCGRTGGRTLAELEDAHAPLTPVTLTEPTPAAAPKMWRDKNGDHWVKAADGSMHRSSPLGLEPSAIETLFGPLTPTTEATA